MKLMQQAYYEPLTRLEFSSSPSSPSCTHLRPFFGDRHLEYNRELITNMTNTIKPTRKGTLCELMRECIGSE